ncbi:MAG: ATP-binding protein, partial [Catalinimonas sp.]
FASALPELSESTVFAVCEDDRNQLWLGTDGGLVRLSADRTAHRTFTTTDGLPDDVIFGLAQDANGYLWASTNGGLSRMLFSGGRVSFSNYHVGNQLPCNAFLPGAYATGAGGTVYFGCTEGVVYFEPDDVRGNEAAPPVHITDFQLFFEPVEPSSDGSTPLTERIATTDEIYLSHRQNVLDFGFVALNYVEPEQNQYAYFMQGFDDDWNYVRGKRNATYTNLDPGRYEFRVKAANNDGVWNEVGDALVIHITPPFYRTPWFYVLAALLVVLGVTTLVNVRTRTLQRNQQELEQRVRERTEEVVAQKAELERILKNLQSAQSQLVESEKMASLGQLTAGVAHEINNPINFVSGNVTPLRRDIDDLLLIVQEYEATVTKLGLADQFAEVEATKADLDYAFLVEEINSLIEGIAEGAGRTADIVKGLRNFSRMDEDEQKLADPHEGLESTLLIQNSEMRNRVELVRDYGELPPVPCYPGQMNQVYMNLLNNALQATDEGGTITIRTRHHPERGEISVAVRDTGCGMSEAVRKRVFEPFFTTKDVGVGTGLGLSITFGIVEKHGGRIEVWSAEGKGSEFAVRLPTGGVRGG